MNLTCPAPTYVLASGLASFTATLVSPAAGPAAAEARAAAPRQRFRAADVSLHLDMAVIGDVCIGVSLAGYRSVLDGFLSDGSGSQADLLAALDTGQVTALPGLAHAVKGAAACLGLRTVRLLAQQIEAGSATFDSADCLRAANTLREHLFIARALLQRMGFL